MVIHRKYVFYLHEFTAYLNSTTKSIRGVPKGCDVINLSNSLSVPATNVAQCKCLHHCTKLVHHVMRLGISDYSFTWTRMVIEGLAGFFNFVMLSTEQKDEQDTMRIAIGCKPRFVDRSKEKLADAREENRKRREAIDRIRFERPVWVARSSTLFC